MTKYLRHKVTGIVYIYTPMLAKHDDVEPYTPPVEMAEEDRAVKILAAIQAVPKETWSQMFGGKYSVPKVADVSAAAGFKVSAQEIRQAIGVDDASSGSAGENEE